ncbi:MAG: hypothetical protein [Bacteriophage sp.]|nr:MAG: hypothetical protein [Bacteriophage sp.]
MNTKQEKSVTLAASLPPELVAWIDSMRGTKSRQAWLARHLKDTRMDYELQALLEQLTPTH